MSLQKLPFLDVFKDATGGNIKTPQTEFLEEGEFPVVDQGQALVAGFVNDRSRVCSIKPPVIVFGDHTRVIKYVDFEFAMGADGTKVLVPKVESDTKYLYYALKAIEIPAAGYSRHYKFLKETQIPLPPLPEQRRIAETLDKADALRAKRRSALAYLDSLTQSIFLDMFGDPATNPREWPVGALRSLGRVTTGGTPPSAKEGMFDGAIPFITPGDLENDQPIKRTVTDAGAEASRTVDAGATLVCCIGATIGKIGKSTVRSAFNQQINAVEWDERMHTEYGCAVMRFFKPTIIAWGSSTTLPILKKSSFERIEIPVPPMTDQQEFALRLERVERVRTTHRIALSMSNELFSALQEIAFRGGL